MIGKDHVPNEEQLEALRAYAREYADCKHQSRSAHQYAKLILYKDLINISYDHGQEVVVMNCIVLVCDFCGDIRLINAKATGLL